jgi:hypothetical protein
MTRPLIVETTAPTDPRPPAPLNIDLALQASLQTRLDELKAGIEFAYEQLEGWVAWKCPAKHKAEHEASIAKLRNLAAGGL